MTTQTAASLDAQIAKPRATPLEIEDGHVLTDCRVQMFGAVVVTPPPTGGDTGPADYEIDPALWTFGNKGSVGGNYRLHVNPNKQTVTIGFTTNAAGLGANINLQWNSGVTSMHTMSCAGKSQQSQTPAMGFSTGTTGPSKTLLQPFTRYVMTISTPPLGVSGTYHVNFNNSPY